MATKQVVGTERRAEVTWHGDLTHGGGTIESVGSGAFAPLDVSWTSRAEEPGGKTSPEELIAAAHAACFAMALSNGLGEAGHAPESISVAATVTFVPGTGITSSAIDVQGTVSGIDQSAFRQAANDAKDSCPVSKALKGNVELLVTARLLER
jgi:osmotically inducible protein OsmC